MLSMEKIKAIDHMSVKETLGLNDVPLPATFQLDKFIKNSSSRSGAVYPSSPESVNDGSSFHIGCLCRSSC